MKKSDHMKAYILYYIPNTYLGWKESMPNWVIYLNPTPIFEWWAVKCRTKNGHHKNLCLKESRLRAQNLSTILGSIVNIIGGGPM